VDVPTPPLTPIASSQPQRGRSLKIAGIAAGAAGLVAIAAGGVLGGYARANSDVISHATRDQVFNPAVERTAKTEQTAAIALWSIGGAALVGGVALWLVGRHTSETS